MNAAPAAAIRVEVAKWQTWTALRMQEGGCPRDEITAQLEKLAGLEKDIDKELAEERMLNDPHAHRLRELEAKADAVATGRRWVAERCGAS